MHDIEWNYGHVCVYVIVIGKPPLFIRSIKFFFGYAYPTVQNKTSGNECDFFLYFLYEIRAQTPKGVYFIKEYSRSIHSIKYYMG